MNKKIVIGLSLFLGVVLYTVWNLRQDLALVDLLSQAPENLSVTLQNVETTRQSGDDLWRLKARSVVRNKGRDDLTELTAESVGEEGERKQLKAPSGVHFPDRQLIELVTPSGLWDRPVGNLVWRADEVSWQQKEDLWLMKGNIDVQDRRVDGTSMNLASPSAAFEGSGFLVIDEPQGAWLRSDDRFTLTAPEARWEQSKDQWTFPKGLNIVSAQYDLTAQYGQVDQGTFLSVKQGQLVWRSVQ